MEERMSGATSYTVRELWELGKDNIPQDMVSSSHLIYSSPATLAFNSPGAEGFGVKRAGLSVPGSVMLIVSPGCCGRNTSSISTMKGYENRFFYLTMDETDLITGRHLRRIPKAVCELAAGLGKRPSVIMICITCVDALLGTDMERVCKKAEKMVNETVPAPGDAEDSYIRVKPCYMYALTREGRKPPMVHVRQSIYSLLKPIPKRADSVNILGYFAPLEDDCELRDLLRQIGVKKIREVSSCKDFSEFEKMAEANFNLILNPEARPAAGDLQERLGIPSIELTRLYQVDRIAAQYDAFAAALGVKFDYEVYREKAKAAMNRFRGSYPEAVFSIGEAINADPFELALALVRYGFRVKEIFGTITTDSYRYIRHLSALSPETRVYSNLSPSMLLYGEDHGEASADDGTVHIALGRDAGWYHPDYPCLLWGQDIQPFGFMGVCRFFEALTETMQGAGNDLYGSAVRLTGDYGTERKIEEISRICGFDEPRWFRVRSAVFSAGLRDMDAILGRDERLVKKLADTAALLSEDGNNEALQFAAIIGTPVPAVIGTDFRALERMSEKKTGLPCIGIACDGMEFYDKGAESAYLALFEKFAAKAESASSAEEKGCIGILGAQYMDLGGIADYDALREYTENEYGKRAVIYGSRQDGTEAFADPVSVCENLVITVSGYEAAKALLSKYSVPFRCCNPLAERQIRKIAEQTSVDGKRILVVHEQITANSCRKTLRELGAGSVDIATWFMLKKELSEAGDLQLSEETDLVQSVCSGKYDIIIADPVMLPLLRECFDGVFAGLPHFAVSGKL